MINYVRLLGNVGKDPTIHRVDENTVYARFWLATDEVYKNAQGEKVKNTDWHWIKAKKRAQALYIEKNVRKGMLVDIEGSLHTENWVDKEGVQHTQAVIRISQIRIPCLREQTESKTVSEKTDNTDSK